MSASLEMRDNYFIKQQEGAATKGNYDEADTFDCCEDDYAQIMLEQAADTTVKTDNSTKTSEEDEKRKSSC